MMYLRKVPQDLKPGEKRESSCLCGGKLFVHRDKLDKHLHVFCEECGFQMIQ